jgi:peptidoglycan/xylan/chitin deacetylase (PgdA/CDA1 family)
MIRNASAVGTFPLFPSARAPGLSSVSGSAGQREAALCFDLYDDDRGLPEVLNALNRRNIKSTFFLNGEFIRRHPQAVKEITAAGHEVASMFFAMIDLSGSRYRASQEFIAQRLARNEDEYFRVTGKELALLWHPPWYIVSPDILAAAAAAGYSTARGDIDPLDWISREDEKRFGLSLLSSSEMIEKIIAAVKPGDVIPVRLGLLPGGRNDYLFNRVNVLIDALIREGYTPVTVSAVMECINESSVND